MSLIQLGGGYLKEILIIGMPAMLQQVLISLGFIVIQILVNGFGTDCIAAFISASVILSVFPFTFSRRL